MDKHFPLMAVRPPGCVNLMERFSSDIIETGETTIFVRVHGSGSPILLLHGFPETSLMWRDLAPLLADTFTVVCADLRGYGDSGCPASAPNHAPYSKRAMAQDMVTVMERLGFSSFSVVGHDRGGRVAYRMALDHPARMTRLAVLDVLPTETVWQLADARFTLAFWPWSLLAQQAPLPERILSAAADAIVDYAFATWGPLTVPPQVRQAYIQALQEPVRAHALCEEYRAAATIDREHDRADLAAGRRIACPLLVLWSAHGTLETWYRDESGPLALWRTWADDVRGLALDAGHFFPEEASRETADALNRFLR
jgi:haloacetate dehalogenase